MRKYFLNHQSQSLIVFLKLSNLEKRSTFPWQNSSFASVRVRQLLLADRAYHAMGNLNRLPYYHGGHI